MISTQALPTAASLVRAFGAQAKKSLGQNFITDPSILERIVVAADLPEGAHVLEVGPGPGTLTRTLLALGFPVTSVELDRHAVGFLNDHFLSEELTVIEGDILKCDLDELLPRPTHCIGNLPYNIATEVFFRLELHPSVRSMTFMFQREVARRFPAEPGTKTFGPLALLSAIRWESTLALSLPPGAFVPRPKVHSAVVHFSRKPSPAVQPPIEPAFRRLVKKAFQGRRKMIRNALVKEVDVQMLEAVGIVPTDRPEVIGFERYNELAELWKQSRGFREN